MNLFLGYKNNSKWFKNCYNHDAVEKRTSHVFPGLNVRGDVKNIQ